MFTIYIAKKSPVQSSLCVWVCVQGLLFSITFSFGHYTLTTHFHLFVVWSFFYCRWNVIFFASKWIEEGQISYYFIKVTMISATMLRFESVLGGFNSVVDGSNDSYLEVSKLPHQKEKKWNGMKWKKRSRRRKSALAFFISRHTRMVFSFLLFLFFFRLYKVTHSDTQVSSSGNFRVLLECLCMAAWSKM